MQADRSFAVSFVAAVARPDQADPGAPLSLYARLPRRHALRRRGQISSSRRNCLEPRSECEWKTDQRAMKIESGSGTALRHNLRPAAKRRHQRLQCFLDFENHPRTARGKQWHVTAELDRITETLLSVEKNSLASDAVSSGP